MTTKRSSEQVQRIHSVHVANPKPVRKAWERLHDCYAAHEIIEQSFFQIFDSFLKISAKDHTKLREVRDLLVEIQVFQGVQCGD